MAGESWAYSLLHIYIFHVKLFASKITEEGETSVIFWFLIFGADRKKRKKSLCYITTSGVFKNGRAALKAALQVSETRTGGRVAANAV
jgi:hypothetical protein